MLLLLAALSLVTAVKGYYIPSRSMEPALEPGDRILVDSDEHDVTTIDRGDIVVVTAPKGETFGVTTLVKRVIGLPDETVTIDGGHVLIDGHVLDEPYLAPDVPTLGVGSHPCPPSDPCHIPDDAVWLMGDNRTDSKDSRFFGPVAESTIVGRAFARYWPLGRIGSL